jgi:hypothetical protein
MVKVTYGLMDFDGFYFDERRMLFPNSHLYVLGGCFVGDMGDAVERLVCTECRKVEEQWHGQEYPML